MEKKLRQEESFVRLKINLERLKIELSGRDAHKCLREVNKILDKVNRAARQFDEIDFDFESVLSEELMMNTSASKLLNQYSQIYDDYRTNRVAIENKKVVELEKGKVEDTLTILDVKKAITKLLFHIQKEHVKHAIVHIKGTVEKDEAKKVTDMITQELHKAEIHTVFSPSEVSSHTIVEAVFFGDFDSELEN
mgnify:CR=1 FL=1